MDEERKDTYNRPEIRRWELGRMVQQLNEQE
jgi:hypothetical protein